MENVKRRKENSNPNKNKIAIFILILSVIALCISSLIILNWFKDNKNTDEIMNNISNTIDVNEVKDSENTELVNPPDESTKTTPNDYWDFVKLPLISVDFSKLIAKNKDTVGWINVNNTNINYPVVQTKNNDDYMNKAFDGTKNQAGWIFADYRNDMKDFDKNTIIYGHSRLNQTMFGSLLKVLNKSWYTNKYNHVIKFSTPTENTMWQIFSVYKIEPETYYLTTDFNTDTTYQNFLNKLKSRSIYNFNIELNTYDKIMTLSTCSDAAGTGRVVVHAKLIKKEVR